MGFIRGPGGDPALQQLPLGSSDRLVGFRRRHDLLGIGADEAGEKLGIRRVAGDEGLLGESLLPDIKSHLALASLRVGAVALEAVVGKDRPDVAVEPDLVGAARQGNGPDGEASRQSKHGL